jgi:hypothetical protein
LASSKTITSFSSDEPDPDPEDDFFSPEPEDDFYPILALAIYLAYWRANSTISLAVLPEL